MTQTILVVYGTRPEQIKLAPICRELEKLGVPIHRHSTGQSHDLLDQSVLKWDSFGPLPPEGDYALCMVQGDARATFEGAYHAFLRNIPIMHVESGLRTGDFTSPYPEEGLRKMISQIATYHACTTSHNLVNLMREHGGPPDTWAGIEWLRNHRVTGSPVVESVRERAASLWSLTGRVSLSEIFAVVTLHRRENRGHFRDILLGIDDALPRGLRVLWFSHPNGWAAAEDPGIERIANCGALGAENFAIELANARIVISDSGGVAEECQTLGTPLVQARTVTDRPESLHSASNPGGCALLGGNTRAGVSAAIEQALQLDRYKIDRSIYGDGTASIQISKWIAEIVG